MIRIILIPFLFVAVQSNAQDSLLMESTWYFQDSSREDGFRIIDSLTLTHSWAFDGQESHCRSWKFKEDSVFEERLLDTLNPLSEYEKTSWKRTGIKPPQSRDIIGFDRGKWYISDNKLTIIVWDEQVTYLMKLEEESLDLLNENNAEVQ